MLRKRIIISGFRHSRTFVIAQGTLIACDVCKLREITAIMAGCRSGECSEMSMSRNVRVAGLYENSAGQKKLTPDMQLIKRSVSCATKMLSFDCIIKEFELL